jgi:hypothetical protein
MLWKKTRTRVAGSLITGIALLLGVSQAMAETSPEGLNMATVSKPKQLTVSEPKKMGVSEPRIQGVSELGKQKVSKPRPFKYGRLSKGKYTAAQRENAAYTRCAKLKGFDERRKCALESLRGISPEEDN